MGFVQQLREKVGAAVPGIVVETAEAEDALEVIKNVCMRSRHNPCNVAAFDVDRGIQRFRIDNHNEIVAESEWYTPTAGDFGLRYKPESVTGPINPSKVLDGFPGLSEVTVSDDRETPPVAILVLLNPQLWLERDPMFRQKLANSLWEGKRERRVIIMLMPTPEVPPELQGLFEAGYLTHSLPDSTELGGILDQIVESSAEIEEFEPPDGAQRLKILDAAAGLTRLGAEDAITLSVVRHAAVLPEDVFMTKAESLVRKSTGISLSRRRRELSEFGGGEHLKQFTLSLLRRQHSDNPKLRPRGIFCVGVPGSGKSIFAECVATASQRVVATVNTAAMKSKFQGASYANMKQALEVLDAMQNPIALFDEVEGQVGGGKSTGQFDGGVGGQLNSHLLTWLADHDSDVFSICTANDIEELLNTMPEFVRSGRFDGMFFFDFPDRQSKDAIWKIHLRGYDVLSADSPEELDVRFEEFRKGGGLPDDDKFTGAEIEACCRLAQLQEVPVAEIGNSLPTMATQARDKIESLQAWADGKCYSLERRELYCRPGKRTQVRGAKKRPGRRPNIG